MGKIYKMNKTGTVGVSLTKKMREAGFVAGASAEWFEKDGGFILMLFKAANKPVEPIKEEKATLAEAAGITV